MEHVKYNVHQTENGIKLLAFLRRRGLSLSFVRRVKYCERGLLVNGATARTNTVLAQGDCVEVALPDECCSAVPPEEIFLDIVYESPHALVINKPAGMVMHPTLSHRNGTLANAFAFLMQVRKTPRPLRLVGRLDADTSGLVLCAMDALCAPQMAKEASKEYIALAQGKMPLGEGEIDAPLAAKPGSVVEQWVHPNGKSAYTKFEVLDATPAASVVRVWPKTGRTHQIRAHFAHMGHPLLGDSLYGADKNLMQRHALHCAKITFTEPNRPKTIVQCPLPPDMLAAAERAGLQYIGGLGSHSQGKICQNVPKRV